MPMTCAIYTRVSTKEQDTAMQFEEIEQYCLKRELTITKRYTDTASGSKRDRAGLGQLMADAREHKFGSVIVYRFDRFARSLSQLVSALDEFRSLGIEFASIHENIDTTTPQGKLIFGIFGSIAEFEREIIRERVRSGLAAAKRRGKRLGAKPKHAHKADEARRLIDSGLTTRQVARQVGCSFNTVARMVR